MPSEQIDPMLFEKSYYLEPEKTGAKPYALLREALEAADRMALVTVSLRNRMSLAVLRVRDDVIVMQTMMWPDEIRKPDFGSVDTSEAKPAEVKMATMLVETLAGDFDPSEFEDDYREAVEALVKAKIEGGEVKRTPEAKKSSGEVVDLLAALQRSVDAAKTARGEAPKDSGDADASDDSAERLGQRDQGEEVGRQEVGGQEVDQEDREEDHRQEAGQEGQLDPRGDRNHRWSSSERASGRSRPSGGPRQRAVNTGSVRRASTRGRAASVRRDQGRTPVVGPQPQVVEQRAQRAVRRDQAR